MHWGAIDSHLFFCVDLIYVLAVATLPCATQTEIASVSYDEEQTAS